MENNLIITIGRQYASGGHAIAKELSELMGIKMYDKELLNIVSRESGISEEILKTYDEKPTNSFLYSLSLGAYPFENAFGATPTMPLIDKVFAAQSEIIKKLADEGPCIFVGRCADSVLRDRENLLSVFIHTDIERRIDRVCDFKPTTRVAAREEIKKADKKRANYYNYFSDSKWGNALNYDLCLDSRIGVDNAAQLIKFFAEHHKG